MEAPCTMLAIIVTAGVHTIRVLAMYPKPASLLGADQLTAMVLGHDLDDSHDDKRYGGNCQSR